jgi:large subunit ribosomal protein L22
MQIKAQLSEYRQSPRKVRLLANLIKGKKISDAKDILLFTVKRAAHPIAKLLNSVVKNAEHNFNISADNLFVKNVRVDEGVVLKRRRPRARGTAYPIKKRTSNVVIELDTMDNMPRKGKMKNEKLAIKK